MKLHIITVGKPKLEYAALGFQEYAKRLGRYHQVRISHLADRHNDTKHILAAAGDSYLVALVIEGKELTSPGVAQLLADRELTGGEVCFVIGGPEGLPEEVRTKADLQWSFGRLTFPHDLAMVILLEALYRASSINAGHPYHK